MSTSTSTKYAKPLVIGIILGGMLTFALTKLITSGSNSVSNVTPKERVPLYWVAPVDANYTKDKPGKSPMGMDLVPVYDDGGEGPDEGPSTIRISPDVVNNLGVRTVNVQYKKLNNQINTVGYVTYNEDKLDHIHPRVQGWIEKLYVKAVEDPVKKTSHYMIFILLS